MPSATTTTAKPICGQHRLHNVRQIFGRLSISFGQQGIGFFHVSFSPTAIFVIGGELGILSQQRAEGFSDLLDGDNIV